MRVWIRSSPSPLPLPPELASVLPCLVHADELRRGGWPRGAPHQDIRQGREDPKFPAGDLMSQYLDSLPLGAAVDIKGPVGHIEYAGRGNFTVGGEMRFARRLAMVAGRTGITPVYQVIQAVLRDQPDDDTEMHLVCAGVEGGAEELRGEDVHGGYGALGSPLLSL